MDVAPELHEIAPTKWPTRPYKGLNYFRGSDAPLFGERDRDIRDCGMLLCQFSTRVLLLHGNSGAGKSSFLRAGLVPWLRGQHGAFHFLTDQEGEPIFIRSTDDPIARIDETLRIALKHDPLISAIETREMQEARFELEQPPPQNREWLAKRIVSALSAIAHSLTPTLVLMIDQNEEVFSTASLLDEDRRRSAYFDMLEELCYNKLPLKVVVVMRTEFYGRFSNALDIRPHTNIENGNIGFRQYLLRDLQTKESLVAVILRPTLGDTDPESARSAYGFTFAPGVPERLADDLLAQFGETCPLPVLQIVCETLYRNVVMEGKRSEITEADYVSVGGALGFMDKYIDAAIDEVLLAAELDHSVDVIRRWRHVLASLVGRQGSGSVTTLIATEHQLVETAKEQKLCGNIRSLLLGMLQKRLLREVPTIVAWGDRRYSLGHDAIAVSLCIWSEAWRAYEGHRRAAERQLRTWRIRTRIAAIGTASFLIAGSGFFLYDYVSNLKGTLKRTTGFISSSDDPSFSVKLYGLVTALDLSDSPVPLVADYLDRDAAKALLRRTLLRSPRYGINGSSAVGFDFGTQQLASLDDDGTVSVRKFASESSERNLGRLPEEVSPEGSSLAAIGFVQGIPIAYRNGLLYAYAKNQWTPSVSLYSLLPDEFKTGTPPFVDIAGDSIRAIVSNPRERTFNLLVVIASQTGDGVKFNVAGKVAVNRSEGRYVPTISDNSNLVAKLAIDDEGGSGSGSLMVTDLSQDAGVWQSIASISPLNQQTGLDFARSISFSPDNESLAMRYEQMQFRFYALKLKPEVSPPIIGAENWPSSSPPTLPNLRPVMGAVNLQGPRWRLAWPTERGVVAANGEYGGLLKPLGPFLEKASDGLFTNRIEITRLKFSMDGRFLAAESRGFGNRTATVLIWDLSTERETYIDSLELAALKREACRVAGIAQGAVGSKDMFVALFGETVDLPCLRNL
ncbi:hypothetical protein MRS76_25700 [Rhizobiaceae bacterium n13]|uniref:nSTAND1 domain-containing NTPase n=1 Tax=Ferirhizobium litorale TaxID=2927786 RepID=UPI0024B2D00F|nr:hypothetical protein [Fererhizobium litorale]MDI7865293.1 hypothetical protein [Fererhizobium litorale]